MKLINDGFRETASKIEKEMHIQYSDMPKVMELNIAPAYNNDTKIIVIKDQVMQYTYPQKLKQYWIDHPNG